MDVLCYFIGFKHYNVEARDGKVVVNNVMERNIDQVNEADP